MSDKEKAVSLTPRTIERARLLRARGLSDRAICAALGISQNTFSLWLQKGRAGEEPYASFVEALQKGEAEFEAAAVGTIFDIGIKGNWSALAWLLERLFPERYGKRDKVDANITADMRITWVDLVKSAMKEDGQEKAAEGSSDKKLHGGGLQEST